MSIVAIHGEAGSGKDTFADMLVARGYTKIGLADEMKRAAIRFFGYEPDQMFGASERRHECPPGGGPQARIALQKLGAEYGRSMYEDVWINGVVRAIETLTMGLPYQTECRLSYTQEDGIVVKRGWAKPLDKFVIPDVRYMNEFLISKRELGARMIKIVRPGAGLKGEASLHSSEHGLETVRDGEWDKIIMNDKTLYDFQYGECHDVIREFKL